MSFLTLLLTSPFVLLANIKKEPLERFILLKLFGIWLLSLVYITANDNFRIPIGIICAILIVYKSKNNRKSKLSALIVGIISLLLSFSVYLIFKI
jgi:hypothetical protein